MTTNTSSIPSLLRPGVEALFGMGNIYPEEWSEIFEKHKSEKHEEYDIELRYSGLADIVPEGSQFPMDTIGERIRWSYLHRAVGLGVVLTKQCIEDNQYKTEFPQQVKQLKRSLTVTKDTLGANILNNGFNPAYPGGDGQPLFSANHPIDGGVYSNTLTQGGADVDLSEAGLEQMIVLIQSVPLQSGMLSRVMPKKLIVPPALQFTASRLLDSSYRVGLNINDINAIYHNSYIPEGYRVNNYLTNSNAWFILTDADNGLKHFVRTPVEIDVYQDFSTKNVMTSANERYSFGWSNPRAIFGSPGV